ncbi:MAG: AAA family ATPase [Desulfovibrionaceae bacterium]|nr:AAA family ATPase [Desulfovibrionaceae bacterium]
MQKLSIGIDDFSIIRKRNYLYVDKTHILHELIEQGERYFLARSKGYGKSLTLSTLSAMFSGETALFANLAAEAFVKQCAKHICPVLNFNFATLNAKTPKLFEQSLYNKLLALAKNFSIQLKCTTIDDTVYNLLQQIYANLGDIVILIDNYDQPILNCLQNNDLLFKISQMLKEFYSGITSCNQYLRFIMIVGMEKYSTTGVFATLNLLNDITDNKKFSDLFGFTQTELENNFQIYIEEIAHQLNTNTHTVCEKLKENLNTGDHSYKNQFYSPIALLKCFFDKTIDQYNQYVQSNTKNAINPYKCINQGDKAFLSVKNYHIYVDKSNLLIQTNKLINSENKYLCISRPRRFGKTISANMVAGYYDINGNANTTFQNLKIFNNESFQKFANKYIVIKITLQDYLSKTRDIDILIQELQRDIINDLLKKFGYEYETHDLNTLMKYISEYTDLKFVIIIDEWDCILREFKDKDDWQKIYLDFLRSWFKDQDHIALVYMTGILPIKKYGTHSALNMFNEYSMLNAQPFTEFVGFTEDEVRALCKTYQRDFTECKYWYDGYQLDDITSIYNPRSVNQCIYSGQFKTYWNNTETYEALRLYITMAYDGLHDCITQLLANDTVSINTASFVNDMRTFKSKHDILTLLVHLGYLSYDCKTNCVRIPNKEIAQEFVTAIQDGGWEIVAQAIANSKKLLDAVLKHDCATVAEGISRAHLETSYLQYNDENALAYTISLAFYAARERYTIHREFPTGKGFADLVFLPRFKHKDPILIIELKVDKSAGIALKQICERNYPASLMDQKGDLLLVGINYDRHTKEHTCSICSYQI